MYDINTKNVKKGRTFYFVFLLLGVLFLVIIGAILVSSYTRLNSLDSTTMSTSVAVKGTTSYSPIYYYEIDGREYSCSSNTSSSIYPETSNKTVYYDSKNPENCMTEYSKSTNNILLLFMLLPLVFVVYAIINMRKISKRLKLINELNQKGKLVKNLVYHLENTGMSVNHVRICRPVIKYTLPSGSVITLFGDPRHDGKKFDDDGMVDLIIDENNPNNYFIDFEINRLAGNLATDYFNDIDTSLHNNLNTNNNVDYAYNNHNNFPQN